MSSVKITAYFIKLILLLGLLTSCLDEGARKLASLKDASSELPQENQSGQESELTAAHWYSMGQSINSLILDSNYNDSVFLRGSEIHAYLKTNNNSFNNYCLSIKFNSSSTSSPKEYRVRLIPGKFLNTQTDFTEYYYRVNVNGDGNDLCQTPGATDQASELSLLCSGSTCEGQIQSNAIKVFNQGDFFETKIEGLNLSPLKFIVNLNNDTSNPNNTCSQIQCQANGSNYCCVSGQCVKDGQVKGNVNTSSTPFTAAESEKENDPFWFLKYPEFYYACTIAPPTNGDNGGETGDPNEEAQIRLQKMKDDYACLNELGSEIKNNYGLEPFQNGYFLADPGKNRSCNVPNTSLLYSNVVKRLYTTCGCEESTIEEMINNCPKYSYKEIFENNELVRFECVTPLPDEDDVPFQDLNVSVNSRTAPLRFFERSASEPNKMEGEEFMYLDNANQVPKNGKFNMNSIMGQVDVNLSSALPAKVVDVEYDKKYLIATLEGLYTPCPMCGYDSWFSNFTAFPQSVYGTGVQAAGYTTKRDDWGTNSKRLNYEDINFGRSCFLPPTMLPFSHDDDYTDSSSQRLARKKTQAFMYVNGYQRDWYGFNKGALIGSFDGVSWFAIGKGRIAKATSNKLYLAINAPFADLAENNEHTVSIQEYDFISTGAKFDYDFNLSPQDSRQNEAGSCQRFHSCATDTDCVTKLGWEYKCVDVNQYKTNWPKFNPMGSSEDNGTLTGTIADFLNQGELSGESKRCVYRGAGAPCQTNYESITTEGKRKALSCAPNFYCANLNTNEKVFNQEVARFGAPLQGLSIFTDLFGQDAKVLGRPLTYVGHNSSTMTNLVGETQIKNNLFDNIKLMSPTATQSTVGICRPGKALPSYSESPTKLTQHKNFDPEDRTDFISQIAGCNSSLYTTARYASCPILGEDGNYVDTKTSFLTNTFSYKGYSMSEAQVNYYLGSSQNACGLETLLNNTTVGPSQNINTLWDNSPFKSIEARSPATSSNLTEKSLARDACFRRAGSACHTDLDCSPNKMMANEVSIHNDSYFGNLAERKYFEEYLVCGQKTPEPEFGSGEYYSYDMSQNRCCREVGKSITLYTEDTPGVPESVGLRSDLPGSLNPSTPERYSRYSNLEKLEAMIRPSAKLDTTSIANILKGNQWKTISETAAKTCCGGGWVRKFADGSTDWSKRNRLDFEVENFSCINYTHPLIDPELPPSAISYTGGVQPSSSQMANDRLDLCLDPTLENAGCAEREIDSSTAFGSEKKPEINSVVLPSRIHTSITMWDVEGPWTLSPFISADELSIPYLNWDQDPEENLEVRTNIKVYIPAWIPIPTNHIELNIKLDRPRRDPETDLDDLDCTEAPIDLFSEFPSYKAHYKDLLALIPPTIPGLDLDECYYQIDSITRTLIIVPPLENICRDDISPSPTCAMGPVHSSVGIKNKAIGFGLEFRAPGTKGWQDKNPGKPEAIRSSKPGDYFYYLRRLGKLELLGIPQMTYEPLYCNSNYQKLVPGIFDEDLKYASDFNNEPASSGRTVLDTNPFNIPWKTNVDSLPNAQTLATKEAVAHDEIFSADEFKCCINLGEAVADYNQCCSGYAVDNEGGNPAFPYLCKLPPATDLNVYLNRFVSGAGVNDSNLTTPFTLDDFEERSGEPKQTSAIIQKLRSFGQKYCSSGKVRIGGGFGSYHAEPYGKNGQAAAAGNNPVYGIVDSLYDQSEDNGVERGFTTFKSGYKWNHHIYCDEEEN